MYLIAREYEIPREDRQKIFGIQPVAEYCKQIMQAMKVESWRIFWIWRQNFRARCP